MRSDDGMYLVPESYAVPADLVAEEYKKPGSQPREVVGRCPFLWGQSLYILGKLLQEVRMQATVDTKTVYDEKTSHFP